MDKKKCPPCPKCLAPWLGTFGDLMSLLLTFFVLLLSMSTIDTRKVSEVVGSLSGALSVLEGGVKTDVTKKIIKKETPVEETDDTTEAVNKITQTVIEANEMIEKGRGETISLSDSEEGFVIKMPASILFKPASAKIYNEDAILFLKRVALIISKLPNELDINIQGHTDNTTLPKDSQYRDNWDLSSARATAVLKELMKANVSPKKMYASGYSKYRPIASNVTEEGRRKNRRVELHFYGKKSSKEETIRKSILDKK